LCSEGMITVNVQEHRPSGSHVFIVAPAMLVPLGMHFVPQENLREAREEVQPYLPTIRAALDELSKCEDATFVEVDGPNEHVRVAKHWSAFVVDVNEPGETVHVSVPIRAARSAIEQLVKAGPAS
jgi:hypothetical protein